ncbi:heat shock protein beta-1 [Melanotaenia boesemani]|uniref:heat shock protein beta-1 n=1 Tax=Melanotaenia boesemani TaxID=1250792 RepID=UPI001C04BE03|nr:heat shock protein beta-1 [Melanotaenia boesemani]
MQEQAKTEMSCGKDDRAAPWYPLRKWWQSSQLFNQDIGLPPFLEPGYPRWTDVDQLQRTLAACLWPGYVPAPLFVPHISDSMHHPSQKISRWRVSLDVAHFSPSEILLSIRDGFLEVGGKHEEKPDEHGFIARCFTRKYRLPGEVDATKMVSTLSVDGILTVEAPVPETSAPSAILIPIKVEIEDNGEQEVKQEDQREQAQPGGATTETEMETFEKPAGELHPSDTAEDESTECLQQSSEHHETLESKENLSTSTQEAVVLVAIQAKEEGAEDVTQPEEQEMGKSPQSEVQSQELEAADMKQEHTK